MPGFRLVAPATAGGEGAEGRTGSTVAGLPRSWQSPNLPRIVFIKVRYRVGDGVCGGEALLKAGASA